MGWIKIDEPTFSFPDGYILNSAHVNTFYVVKCKGEKDLYQLNCEDGETTYLLLVSTKEDVFNAFSRLERWLESGAEGVFQI